MTIESYRIDRRAWECECEHCGCPLEVGERAWDVDEGAGVGCSLRCARIIQARVLHGSRYFDNAPGGRACRVPTP